MARVTIEDCLERVESRFVLVHLAVRRVLQLRSGATLLLDRPKNKEVVVALREIAAGRVTTENIRDLEEMRFMPEIAQSEKVEATQTEVREILEAATKYDASLEYDDQGEYPYSDED
jgi:DNA-directed RNA polymerase subunit omega